MHKCVDKETRALHGLAWSCPSTDTESVLMLFNPHNDKAGRKCAPFSPLFTLETRTERPSSLFPSWGTAGPGPHRGDPLGDAGVTQKEKGLGAGASTACQVSPG